MSHVNSQLTRNVEIGAVRVDGQDALEIVTQDNLQEVRNSRVDVEPRRWEIAIPVCHLEDDTTDYDAVRLLWKQTERGLHTFNFYDFVEDEVVKARFASPVQITAPAGHLRHIDTFTIREVQE